jgi:hypothetical protein
MTLQNPRSVPKKRVFPLTLQGLIFKPKNGCSVSAMSRGTPDMLLLMGKKARLFGK